MIPEQERLVTENIKLAYHIANQFQNTGVDEDDLESAATFGLLKAAQTFDESKGFRFATYAGQCIQNEIRMILRNNRKHSQVVYLDDSIYANDEGDKLTYIDCIEDSNSDFITPILQHEDFEGIINVVFNRLSEKNRLITLYSFAGKKQRWIADTLEISQSYVSRLIPKCYEEIKKAMKQNECKGIFSFYSSNLLYSISFLKQDVPFFDEAYQNLKEKETEDITSVFQMQQEKNRIILSTIRDVDNFFYFARLFQEFDHFQFHDKKILESPTKKATSIKLVQKKTHVVPFESKPDLTPKSTEATLETIQNYFLTLDSFSLSDLRKKFPDVSLFWIRSSIHLAEIRKLISPISKNSYEVHKTKP